MPAFDIWLLWIPFCLGFWHSKTRGKNNSTKKNKRNKTQYYMKTKQEFNCDVLQLVLKVSFAFSTQPRRRVQDRMLPDWIWPIAVYGLNHLWEIKQNLIKWIKPMYRLVWAKNVLCVLGYISLYKGKFTQPSLKLPTFYIYNRKYIWIKWNNFAKGLG